ncbi:MAG: ABC transporter ATP-binding protein [Candidatus Bathyarchaeota archaeon]|nr:MAG: ABC transporter ATP-binding protein [Candidatus Bathyarchaeota archaeon]
MKNLNISLICGKDLSAKHTRGCDLIKVVGVGDLRIHEGETVGLIGPSATGKTVTAKAIMGILQPIGAGKPEWEIEGEVLFKGRDLLKLSEEELNELRGNEISIIFQKPSSSLHPLLMVGYQTGEPVEAHEDVERQRLLEMVLDYLGKVELPDAKRRARFFRHQFSGGEAQRIMIAMALIYNPSLLIADEPTSDLDVTVQRQVLELLKRVKEGFGLAMLLITHDLGVIAEMSDYVYVMYAGRIVEHGDVYTIFEEPRHPYTRGLLRSIPRIDTDHFTLEGIPGELPKPPYDIPGCVFHPRCEHVKDHCKEKSPAVEEFEPGHYVACLRAKEI